MSIVLCNPAVAVLHAYPVSNVPTLVGASVLGCAAHLSAACAVLPDTKESSRRLSPRSCGPAPVAVVADASTLPNGSCWEVFAELGKSM